MQMYKRYQVLLSDWLEDYIKLVSKSYDISFSEVIRVHMGIAILYVIPILFPEYKPNLENDEFRELSKKAAKGELKGDEVHQMASKILFEARKAVEHRVIVEQELKKK